MNRKFIIFNISDVNLIDFSKVLETSEETLRKNKDKTKSFIKWDTEEIPSFIENISSREGPYTYEEMLTILDTSEWLDIS